MLLPLSLKTPGESSSSVLSPSHESRSVCARRESPLRHGSARSAARSSSLTSEGKRQRCEATARAWRAFSTSTLASSSTSSSASSGSESGMSRQEMGGGLWRANCAMNGWEPACFSSVRWFASCLPGATARKFLRRGCGASTPRHCNSSPDSGTRPCRDACLVLPSASRGGPLLARPSRHRTMPVEALCSQHIVHQSDTVFTTSTQRQREQRTDIDGPRMGCSARRA